MTFGLPNLLGLNLFSQGGVYPTHTQGHTFKTQGFFRRFSTRVHPFIGSQAPQWFRGHNQRGGKFWGAQFCEGPPIGGTQLFSPVFFFFPPWTTGFRGFFHTQHFFSFWGCFFNLFDLGLQPGATPGVVFSINFPGGFTFLRGPLPILQVGPRVLLGLVSSLVTRTLLGGVSSSLTMGGRHIGCFSAPPMGGAPPYELLTTGRLAPPLLLGAGRPLVFPRCA